jgi:DNA-binding transcriptional ArsR family regulator
MMKIIRLLGAMAVLSLLIIPAISEHAVKSCDCISAFAECHKDHATSCCNKTASESCTSQVCICPSQTESISGMEFYDPDDCYYGKGSSRSFAKQSMPSGPTSSNDVIKFSNAFSSNRNSIGPPDLDVVEYLPPSAKQVFNALAMNGPLTQKDLIGRTDLPPRTVRYALSRLKGEDMLEERFCFRDARQILYSLNGMTAK